MKKFDTKFGTFKVMFQHVLPSVRKLNTGKFIIENDLDAGAYCTILKVVNPENPEEFNPLKHGEIVIAQAHKRVSRKDMHNYNKEHYRKHALTKALSIFTDKELRYLFWHEYFNRAPVIINYGK